MLKKTVSTLIVAALAALGATQVYAQKNYTEGGDLYGGSHTKKASPNQNPAKSGKFDPYTDGAKAGKADPYTDGAKAPASQGGKAQ